MDNGICYLIGAGVRTAAVPLPGGGDLVLAADGGYAWLRDMGRVPHVLIGDMDSLDAVPEGVEVIRLPTEKDDTDMMAAVRLGLERGYRRFHIYGGTGGRFDHTLANLQLLTWLSRQKCAGVLWGEGWTATAITDSALALKGDCGGLVSVFVQGDRAEGVNLTGLKYPLKNATLTCDIPLGVSNEFIGVPGCISVGKGTLLVVQQREEPAD